jgi:hypothetical protein
MHLRKSIAPVRDIFQRQGIALPEEPGVYAFWWTADRAELLAGNCHIVLKGPAEKPVDVEYKDWWPKNLKFPCLYVGKTTNIKNRFALHIKRGSKGRLHFPQPGNRKAKPNTTSCQLRFGIEHVFPREQSPLELIFRCVGFSYTTKFPDNAIAERFFEEDRLVGTWRPWFNVDSER